MFKIGNFYYPDGGGTFLENLAIALLAACVGLIGAWLIFKKTLSNNRNEQNKNRENYLDGRLRFMTVLLDKVIIFSEKQIEEYIIQAENILSNPFEFHKVRLYASDQLKRLKEIDSQDIFEAYIDFFGNNQGAINEYLKFLDYIDFLDHKLANIHQINQNNIEHLYTYQQRMKVHIDELYSHFYKFCHDDPHFINIWNEEFPKFTEYNNSQPLNIREFTENYLKILYDKVKVVTTENTDNQTKFLCDIRLPINIIEHYKLNNEDYARAEALTLKSKLSVTLKKLKEFLEKLKKESSSNE